MNLGQVVAIAMLFLTGCSTNSVSLTASQGGLANPMADGAFDRCAVHVRGEIPEGGILLRNGNCVYTSGVVSE